MIGLAEQTGRPPQPGNLSKLVDAIFQPGGHLESALGLEHRPEQADMAQSVADALEADTPLLFEAGTGVGKSLAYLIPGLLHSIDSERPFVVSSHTIALQEQIREKDLKICRDLFQSVPALQKYAHFKTAIMLGRANYCCTTRLAAAIQEAGGAQSELLPNQAREDLIRLTQWAATVENGVLQELSPPPLPEVWDQVNADSSTCTRKNCDPAICFWTGIDVPGPALSQVILTRLPFENPGHPLGEARFEYIRSRGGNPFAELAIPEALTKFRQGLGRLIRCQNDRGHLIILDSRLLRKPYGKHFLQALPHEHFHRFNKSNCQTVFNQATLFPNETDTGFSHP